MTMRRFEVELSGTVTVEVDDEALSEPDENGKQWKVLEAHKDPRRFEVGATLDNVLGHLGIICGVDNRRVGHTDGWADFPEDSANAHQSGYWDVDDVREIDADGRTILRMGRG